MPPRHNTVRVFLQRGGPPTPAHATSIADAPRAAAAPPPPLQPLPSGPTAAACPSPLSSRSEPGVVVHLPALRIHVRQGLAGGSLGQSLRLSIRCSAPLSTSYIAPPATAPPSPDAPPLPQAALLVCAAPAAAAAVSCGGGRVPGSHPPDDRAVGGGAAVLPQHARGARGGARRRLTPGDASSPQRCSAPRPASVWRACAAALSA